MTPEEIIPPPIQVTELKRFTSMEDVIHYVYGEAYGKSHPETTRFIRRKLQPK